MRCAIYARYSAEIQNPTSIQDQVRKCQQFADRRGWTVLLEYICCDSQTSGATTTGRHGLQSLIEDAKRRPAPFDYVLIDDTSRLGRNLADVVKIGDVFRFNNVFIFFVSQGIDTREDTARVLQIVNGINDEQFLTGLAAKTHRGQEGRVLAHFTAGGTCYGYRNVAVEDPSRISRYGRPSVIGVRLEIVEHEAEVIRSVFEMRTKGMGLKAIAHALNEKSIPPAQRSRSSPVCGWYPNSIWEMLRRERYRGVYVWNVTKKVRDPETGKKIAKPRPRNEWVVEPVPEWRIVSDELWERAHSRVKNDTERFGWYTLGGFQRTNKSAQYLFSGLLLCGECRSRMTIVRNSGSKKHAYYGCTAHRDKGMCPNGTVIRQDRLEQQLISALTAKLQTPELLEHIAESFVQQMRSRFHELRLSARKNADSLRRLRTELRNSGKQALNLTRAIAAAGHSAAMLQSLQLVEVRIEAIERQMSEAESESALALDVSDLKEFVLDKAAELNSIILGDRVVLKAVLREHIRELVLKAREADGDTVYEVTGDLELFGRGGRVLQLASPTQFETLWPSPQASRCTQSYPHSFGSPCPVPTKTAG